MKSLGNFLGAFSDGAVLFPLIAVLVSGSGFSSTVFFLSTGVIYILSGYCFRVPMPVQPLKAIAIAAVVSGASVLEVRWAGACVGALCLALWFFKMDKLADRVPQFFIHGIQASLGLLLMQKAFQIQWQWDAIVIGLCLVCLIVSYWTGLSALGLLAAGGALFGIAAPEGIVSRVPGPALLRWDIVLGLALPQIALTSANSVLATRDVAIRYFGERAHRVTIARLLQSIGVGNLVVSLFGGLPFCHGSGGMTAHVRGGSSDWTSNLYIGGFLVGLALLQLAFGRLVLSYPPLLLSALLLIVGFFHVQLCLPSWKKTQNRAVLLTMGAATVLTQNLLWGLVCGIVVSQTLKVRFRKAVPA